MNVFHKVTLQSLKKNKTRTIVTIIGIILSASMICAVTTFASSFMNYAKQTAIYAEGNWHGHAQDTGFETYETIRDSGKTEAAVYLQQLGYAYAQGCENEFKPYIYLLGAGEGVQENLPIHITEGRFPTSREEILLPEHLYTNGGVKYSLEDTLSLQLGERMLEGCLLTQNNPCYIYEQGDEVFNGELLEVRETRSYKVVGFYERLSLEPMIAPGYTAITVADQEASDAYRYDVYFRMDDPKEIYDFMEQLELAGDTNTDLLMYSGAFPYDGFITMFYSLAGIVIGLIMFGSVALIYNAFSISVSERTKQFGLLSSVGATKSQLRRMVFFEALAVSVIGIPLGVLAGVGGIAVTLMLIGDKFRAMGFPIDMRISVSSAAILVAVVVALITVLISAWIPSKRATKVSAVEAIRQNRDVCAKEKRLKTSKLTYKLFGLPGVLAQKHYQRNKKKYRTTVLSLFMSIVLFVSASAFTDYLIQTVDHGFGAVGYDLTIQLPGVAFEKLTPEELLNRMKAAKAVTDGVCLQSRYVTVSVPAEQLTKEGAAFFLRNGRYNQNTDAYDFYSYVYFVDDRSFQTLLKDNKLDEKQFMDPEKPLAIALDSITLFNAETEKYETTRFFRGEDPQLAVRKEKEIPGYYCQGEGWDADGNVVVQYSKKRNSQVIGEQLLSLSPEEAYISTTLQVGSVIEKKPYFAKNNSTVVLLYPESLAQKVLEDYVPVNENYHYAFVSDSHAQSFEALSDVLRDNGFDPKELYNIAESEEAERNIITIVRVFSYGFIVLISLIAAANVFNTISTNISLRRREFAMLKSVGMTQKGFHQMMNYECLLYGFRALLYGLPASGLVTYLIYRAVVEGYETNFRLPWTAIGIAVLSVFLVVFVTMLYSMDKIKKENPIDALKNENL